MSTPSKPIGEFLKNMKLKDTGNPPQIITLEHVKFEKQVTFSNHDVVYEIPPNKKSSDKKS